ncbi:hypothetical protein Avbf_06906 [Armadillidium vulgare]|nr:hypothetical protein Avbf_06906 [Armadillidium vulgare]
MYFLSSQNLLLLRDKDAIESPSEECWSYVGRVTGKQQLHLSDRCMVSGIIQHEMLHALGVFHEQSRPDRDEFVIIHHENIYPVYLLSSFRLFHFPVDGLYNDIKVSIRLV